MVFVKVCGIRDLQTALSVVEAGADALGFVFHKRSPRYVKPEVAIKIAEKIKGKIEVFAVIRFKAEFEPSFLSFCDYVQCYEYLEGLEKRLVLGVSGPTSLEAAYYILDSSHGRGRFTKYPEDFWGLPKERVILSGGLNPDNVAQVVRRYRPFGVDVSSGVENALGVKDPELIFRFVKNAKEALR